MIRQWQRYHWILISALGVIVLLAYLLAQNLQETNRIDNRVDKVRNPVCSILYASLSRLPPNPTSQQVQSRREYYIAYGPAGLRCTNGPLPNLPPLVSTPTPQGPTPTSS